MRIADTIAAVLQRKGTQLFVVPPTLMVFDAIKLMAEKNIGALLVMDGSRLLGVFSERDYTRKVVLLGRQSRQTPVSEIMSEELVVVTPAHGVEHSLRLMTERRVRHLPVQDGDQILGLVSIGDLVKSVINSQQAAINQLEDYIAGGYPG